MKDFMGTLMVIGAGFLLILVLLMRFGVNLGEGELPSPERIKDLQHSFQITGLFGLLLVLWAKVDELTKCK